MMRKIIIGLFLAVFLIPNISSFEFIGNCTDSTTLVRTLNFTFNETERVFEQSPVTCPYGCVENLDTYGDDCSPSPDEQNTENHGIAIAISIILSAMAIAFVYVAMNLTDETSVLSWFFLPLSMLMMVVNIFMLTFYTVDTGIINILSTTGYGIIISIVFIMFYFLVFFFTKGFRTLFKNKRDSERFDDKSRV